MSKNSIYTFDYFQPSEYRFSLDSVFLAQLVAKKYENHPQLSELSILDLCSGCGVIGLELAIHLNTIRNIDFLEVQEIYQTYFEKNLTGIKGDAFDINFKLIQNNYETFNLDDSKRYDIIVSNPPYFFKEEGLLSPSEFKNRCRFFLDSNFKELITCILRSLKVGGEAFVLLRPGVHHGRDLFNELKSLIGDDASADIFGEVRGTNVVRIIKKA
jgi:tRNA1(Val) A37 N6-methylase TrmN6